ncbi:DUF4231 domain-containing protein [Actinomadura rugatobispora]|uniref:DUF4231 domain-containing protein n=1 Tax=Actinomadura rugatobispora TaxID=1994 RepID=A0ABW1AIR6_9ACTN|nr:hypothetical protein GCM10010200_022560 [Actinomadura rugatobispora]
MPGEASGPVAVQQVWDRQNVWSRAADRLKRRIARTRLASLLLGACAAVMGAAAAQTMDLGMAGETLAFGAAVAAALVPLTVRSAGPAATHDWTRLRSVAEALKSEVYVSLAGAGRYRGATGPGPLLETSERIEADGADLLHHLTGIRADARSLPAVSGIDSYARERVRRQLDGYYRPKARLMGGRVRVVRRIEMALGAAGAVCGAAAGAFQVGEIAAWVAVATTLAAAVSTHAAASKYEYQELEYARTAGQLARLLARHERDAAHTGSAEGGDAFAAECELVISAQNEAWMARLPGDDAPALP